MKLYVFEIEGKETVVVRANRFGTAIRIMKREFGKGDFIGYLKATGKTGVVYSSNPTHMRNINLKNEIMVDE